MYPELAFWWVKSQLNPVSPSTGSGNNWIYVFFVPTYSLSLVEGLSWSDKTKNRAWVELCFEILF